MPHQSRRLALVAAALLSARASLGAQTDYFNTDAGRPLTIEDAYALERRSIEIQGAPLRLERIRGGQYRWGIEPELSVGLFPRTQIEIGVPLVFVDDPSRGDRRAGAAGVDMSVLYNLNRETSLPAFAVGVGALLPAGSLGPRDPYGNAKVVMTRTLPLRSMLLAAEVFARAPLVRGQPLEWNAGVGTRWQANVRWAMDAGVGRHLTGDDRGWYLTLGGAYAMGWPWRPARR